MIRHSHLLPALILLLLVTGPDARSQIHRIVSPDTTLGNYFGGAIDIEGGRVLVGASGEPSCGEHAGAAYIFEMSEDGRFKEVARLTPQHCKSGKFFGHAVALSENIALVGGTRGFLGDAIPNPIYVFERAADGSWAETAQLLPENDDDVLGFGAAVALEGTRAVVTSAGDPGVGLPGVAYVFDRSASGSWYQSARIHRAGAFGSFAVLRGGRLAITSPGSGASSDGGIYIFEQDATGGWEEIGRIGGFSDPALRCDIMGDQLVVGSGTAGNRQSGRVDVYRFDEGRRWLLEQELQPISSYDFGAFGSDVVLGKGRLLVVGFAEQINLAYNIDRVVYVFEQDSTGRWRQQHIVDIGSTGFGTAIDLEDRTAVIGEAGDTIAGAAYVVRLF